MADPHPDGITSSARVVELLAPTLGWEKGSELVAAAQARLGMAGATLTHEQAAAVLDDLGRTPGMVGISARFARSRLEAPKMGAPPPNPRGEAPRASHPIGAAGPPSSSMRQPSSVRPGETSVTAEDIADLLTSAMGAEKAQDIVRNALRHLGLAPDRIDRAQAMALLDHLAVEPGVVGLCARFGKARLILRFAA